MHIRLTLLTRFYSFINIDLWASSGGIFISSLFKSIKFINIFDAMQTMRMRKMGFKEKKTDFFTAYYGIPARGTSVILLNNISIMLSFITLQ